MDVSFFVLLQKGGISMKLLEKRFWGTVFALFCLSFSIPAYAADNEASLYQDIFDAAEFAEVREAVFDSEILLENGVVNSLRVQAQDSSANQLENAYKMHSLTGTDFVAALQEGESLSDLISDDYAWIVSTTDNVSIRLDASNGEWEVLGYSTPASEAVVTDSIQINGIDQKLEAIEGNGATPEVLLCFEVPKYHTNFIYVSTESSDFLIPYGSRPDLTGLENGKVYTSQEAGNILALSFDGVYDGEENSGRSGARAEAFPAFVSWICVIALVVVSGLIFFSFRKKKIR